MNRTNSHGYKSYNIPLLILIVLAVEVLGFLSSILSGDVGAVYNSLEKPPLAPPDVVFGVVWPFIYLLIGLSFYFALHDPEKGRKRSSVLLFSFQLLLNFLWSVIFFRQKLFWMAAVMIIVIIILVICTMVRLYRHNRAAYWLLWPYLLWLFYAGYLSFGVAILN